MQFNLALVLSAASALVGITSAVAIPEPVAEAEPQSAAAVTRWSFKVYPQANCGGTAVTRSGTGQTSCLPPQSYKFASTLVTYNDRCIVVFGTGTGSSGVTCNGNITTSPGVIQQNVCYTWPKDKIPTTYNLLCHS